MATKANATQGHVIEAVYTGLVSALSEVKSVDAAIKRSRSKKEGLFAAAVRACFPLTNLLDAQATLGLLVDNVQRNKDNLAVKLGAAKRKEETADGKRYMVPANLSSVKSTIEFAFENGLSLKDDKGEPVSFSTLKKQRAQNIKAAKEAKQEAAAKLLTGVDKVKYDLVHSLQAIMGQVAEMEEASAVSLAAAISPWLKTKAEKLHEANKAAQERAEAEKREAAKAARKSKAKGQNVGDQLAEAAQKQAA